MTKLQFTPQMFECCIRDDVHIVAQKHYEAWYAECDLNTLWRDKYYDKCAELNAAEAKCAELERALAELRESIKWA